MKTLALKNRKSIIVALTLGTAIGVACHSVGVGVAIFVIVAFFANR
ncbi:hypothetical protein [Pseudochryseolinea flava]|nr:hypothetical protein [Pseudochryseolinea flava]